MFNPKPKGAVHLYKGYRSFSVSAALGEILRAVSGYFLKKSIDFLDIREYNTKRILDIREWEVGRMGRAKFQTLTEQMFYTLLCLKEECCGMDILDRVPTMTKKRVNIGSGTLYTLLEQFLEAKIIRETKVEGRRRSYILTFRGRQMLEKECARLAAQLEDYRMIFEKEET